MEISKDGRAPAPYGMAGGEPGACGRNWVERADGSRTEMSGTDAVMMHPGDVFVLETPAGGGYGEPAVQRDAAD